jgi:hypothetical protein
MVCSNATGVSLVTREQESSNQQAWAQLARPAGRCATVREWYRQRCMNMSSSHAQPITSQPKMQERLAGWREVQQEAGVTFCL